MNLLMIANGLIKVVRALESHGKDPKFLIILEFLKRLIRVFVN